MTTTPHPQMIGSSIVENGNKRLSAAVQAEVKREVEAQYAPERSTAGLIQRWHLRRRIKREIQKRVRERMNPISASSLF